MKKTIVITGASTGFGKLTALTLANAGHKVFATMRGVAAKNKTFADELTTLAKEKSLDLHVVELDVTSDASVQTATQQILSHGPVDVVVNNAGVYGGGLDESFTTDDYKSMFEVNVFGSIRVVKSFLPSMRERKEGLFIQVSSLMGRIAIPFAAIYTSSKWAVEAYAESLRYELAPVGVDSVIVQPGAFPTEIFQKTFQGSNPVAYAHYSDTTMPYVQGFGQAFASMMSGDVPNKPQMVADAIQQLIDTPKGERPLRTTVDLMMLNTASVVNEAQDGVQTNFLNFLQLGDLLQTKVAEQV